MESYESGDPDEVLNPKKKVWEKLAEDFKTSEAGLAQWQGNNLLTDKGQVTVSKVKNAPIKWEENTPAKIMPQMKTKFRFYENIVCIKNI